MYSCAISYLLLGLLALSHANTLSGTIDLKRLQATLADGAKSKDVSSLYYALKGLKQLNAKIPDVCKLIETAKYDSSNIEQVFYITNAAAFSGCINYVKPTIMSASTAILEKKDATIPELYYAVGTLKALGKGSPMNKDEALKNLVQLLKKDDSPANYGFVFFLCELIGCESWTVSHAEGALLAADESDGRALHFEGGLPVTSMLLSSVHRSFKSQKAGSPLTEQQRLKFGEYLLSRRSINTPRGAALLLDAAYAIADDEPTPISIVVKGKKYITSESDNIEVSVTDLIGRAVKNLRPEEVVAQSGTRLVDDVVVLSKQPLIQKPNDPTTFVLNLNKIKSQHGQYKLALSAGSKTSTVNIAVLGEIQVGNVEVGVGDVDGTTSPKVTMVAYPNKLAEQLTADHLQKVSLKFTVRDKSGKPVLVQQAFARVGSEEREAIFVAEPDTAKAYKVELNVGNLGKHLDYVSGSYSLTIYLGDSAVSSPVAWPLGMVTFSFAKDNAIVSPPSVAGRGPLPLISHTFRAPDARPPRLVSDVFAGACAAPLLLLVVLWARLRINLSHFPFTPSALVFHSALGASLGLYTLFWLRLSMFETMRYLLPLGVVTFLSGHRLLRRLVSDKQDKQR